MEYNPRIVKKEYNPRNMKIKSKLPKYKKKFCLELLICLSLDDKRLNCARNESVNP